MRSEFEKLPEISEILDRNGGGYYREMIEDYHHNYPYFEKFLNGAWFTWQHQQSKVDDLQRRNRMLNENIKEQGQKLVYQNEVIETQAEKLIDLRDEKAGLLLLYVQQGVNMFKMQKRLDAALEVVKQGIGEQCGDYYLEKVEQLLEGGELNV